MGLRDLLKGKISEQKEHYKTWGREDPEVKAAKETAYREARLERATKEGRAKGLGPQYTPQAPAQRQGGGSHRGGTSWSPNWKGAGDMFSNGGGGFDAFGFGGTPQPKPQPQPMTETKISKTGVVTIRKPYQPAMPQKQETQWDPWSMGPPGVSAHKKKHDKDDYDPYNYILG